MEIVFNNLFYKENKKSILNSINLNIKKSSIIAFVGDNINCLCKIISLEKRPASGSIILDKIKCSRTNRIDNIKNIQSKIGYVEDSDRYIFKKKNVLEFIKSILNKHEHNIANVLTHIEQSLKIVGLNMDVMDKDPNCLSYTEQKRVLLASILSYNPEVIVLDNFDKGFSYRDKEYFKKLFLKLKNKYNKVIILLEKKVDFLFDLVDNIYVINKGEVVLSGTKKLFYNNKLYNYVEMPKIVEFTNYVKREYKIVEYTDRNELIKELYRYIRY